MLLLIWTAVLVAMLVQYFRQKYSKFSSHGVKHLKVVPLFGNMLRVVFCMEHYVDGVDEVYRKYPDERFVGRYEFMKNTIIVQDFDLIKNITIRDFEHFLDHRTFIDEKVEPFFARNLFSLRGQDWKDMRSTLSPAFTISKIKRMMPFIEEVCEQMKQALKKKTKESTSDYIDVDVKDLTSRFTTDVIASCAFGLKVDSFNDEENKFYKIGKIASSFKFRQIMIFFFSSAFAILPSKLKLTLFPNAAKNFFIDLVIGTMKNREARQIIRPDMIHLLMEAKKGKLCHDESKIIDTSEDTGFAAVEESSVGKKTVDRVWSDNDIIAQMLLFLIAGFETVSSSTAFTLQELALQPEIQERLVQEIMEDNAKNNGNLNLNSIQNMTYLDMVISETLRLWPPGPALDRVCTKDYNMGKPNPEATKDYIIRKGDILTIPVWSFHRDPKIFPNPEKFDPERFSKENKHKIHRTAYMPFGLGPRNCIGSRLALCELKVMLYQILLHVEVSISEKTSFAAKLKPNAFHSQLQGGYWLKLKARS